jgi:hypothetical protein
MHHLVGFWFFAGMVLFIGLAVFISRDKRHANSAAGDRYQCTLSANRAYEAQQREHELA